MRIGPRSCARGRCRPSTLGPARASASRCVTRYPAKKMANAILANSAGWNPDAADAHPDPGAVDEHPDAGHQGQQDQGKADDTGCVGVAAQRAVVPQQDQHRGRQDHGDRGPHELAVREPVVATAGPYAKSIR